MQENLRHQAAEMGELRRLASSIAREELPMTALGNLVGFLPFPLGPSVSPIRYRDVGRPPQSEERIRKGNKREGAGPNQFANEIL